MLEMRYFNLALCIIYLLVSIFFYHVIWQQFWQKEQPSVLLIQGETPVYEFVAEHVRLNILQGKNPFAATDRVLYPMGWNIAMEDIAPINGFFFLFLRPFLSIHQSFILIMVASVFFSNITMFWLLRMVGIRRAVAAITGLIYGFTPFVSYRLAGHPTYIALYLFTLPAIFFIYLYLAKTQKARLIFSALLGISFVLMLLTNLYFVIMFVLLVGIWFGFSLIFQFHSTWAAVIRLFRYLMFSGIVAVVLLIPWVIEFVANIRFNPRSVPNGFADNIAFSVDPFGFVWPRYVMLYRPLVDFIVTSTGYKPFFEAFIYPGILLVIATFFYMRFRKLLPVLLLPVYATAITLLIFTLGPFLKIGTMQTSIPLPFLIIHYLPYFQMARAPGRFIAPFVFLMSLVFAFLLQYFILKYRKKQWFLLGLVVCIFFIDQWIYIFPPIKMPLPDRIYAFLQKQPKTPLLEIPFSIRDGLKNHGHLHSVWSMQPQFRHNHSLFGIYAGRVPDNQFSWFETHPMFGPLGKLIHLDTRDRKEAVSGVTPKIIKSSIDFLGVEYVLLKEHEPYSSYSAQLLSSQFTPLMKDNGYSLYKKKSGKRTLTTSYRFNTEDSNWILQDGWSHPEKEGRWGIGEISTLFLNAKPQTTKLIFTARAFTEDQVISIYINRTYIQQVPIATSAEMYTVYVPSSVLKDLNMIQFIPATVIQPSQLDVSNPDKRALSVFYETIELQ